MYRCSRHSSLRRWPVIPLLICLLIICAACASSHAVAPSSSAHARAAVQELTFPNVGVPDLATLDPVQDLDQNATLVAGFIYSGLVRTDQDLHVVPDQATWQILPNNTVYIFTLKAGVMFSDGTPVTAQSYISSWTRALLPATDSSNALALEEPIVGAKEVSSGKARTVSGLKALNTSTLQVTLVRPAPYFLASLTNTLFFPVNQQVIEQSGDPDWGAHLVQSGIGTGPFTLETWQHNVKITLTPNRYYYGKKTAITRINMPFVADPTVAFNSSRAGKYDLVWGLDASAQALVKGSSTFVHRPLLQTDMLFFDTTRPPFDNVTFRQAFAYATNKALLAHSVLNDTVTPAATVIPPGMPGYQEEYEGLPYDASKASSLLHSLYPDTSQLAPVVFTYPSAQLTEAEATSLQQMWQDALGIQVTLAPVEENAYDQETRAHQVSFGFFSWMADFPDPYACLPSYLSTGSNAELSMWNNDDFKQLISQAEATTGDARLALYGQAEQLAVEQAAWIPLDHQNFAAVISSWVHGVTINGNGLSFGDWSDVYVMKH